MENYQTVVEALAGLKERGFTLDFNLANGVLHNSDQNIALSPDDFSICEIHRFEGMSDPADNMIVYAIKSDKYNLKGSFVNGYNAYSDDVSEELLKKLNTPG
ncbi:phosphoribosylpyrophosphate synthetase [Pedobacter sp. SYSU D00535]|uniref:phosphoribosylpyrophosphate synthetase n=1 Tax=Pedobacter sp. SYSU D00535 TaxID=2810308 RepID=UPI001A960F0D|nr:phosphoribosylpyrophosphate synthetase [Pedobacter sp. SYSU D00535]